MFNVKSWGTEGSKRRNMAEMSQFSAACQDLPLKQDWQKRWCTLPTKFQSVLESILKYEVREDDVFVVTFPKCGTTWMMETVWLLRNNLDFEQAKRVNVADRAPFLDWIGFFDHLRNSLEVCDELPSPRIIKSHLPANLLPQQIWQKKAKIVFVARNVKDTFVSSYHFFNGIGNWEGSLDEFMEDFTTDQTVYAPYWSRVADFWHMRHEPNIFFVTYEEMKRDLGKVLGRLCKFLERPQLTADELKKLMDHLSFDKMKVNQQTNITENLKGCMPAGMNIKDEFQFMRRGIVGSYKDDLTPEHKDWLDLWSRQAAAQCGLKVEDIFEGI